VTLTGKSAAFLIRRMGLGLVLAGMMSGCINLGPDYVRPKADVESHWMESTDPRVNSKSSVDVRWWQSAFQDRDIDQLVEMALNQNLSLRSAGLRVLQAQQQLAIAIGFQFPQNQQLSSSIEANNTGPNLKTFSQFNIGPNLSWEIDFWGKFRRQIESAAATVDFSVASYDAVLISLVAEVAQTYILIRTYQSRLEVTNRNVDLQTEALRISQAKFDAGEVSALDMDQAKTLLNNTKATLSALQISLQQLKNTLATLLGKPPQYFTYLFDETLGIPAVPKSIALGMPQDLIRRRPDIRSAEHLLAAQSAQIGVAMTDLYPAFSIGGIISLKTTDLFKNGTDFWDVFGRFDWKIFNYGRLQSNVRLQDALFQQLLVDYLNTVLQAQGDVENAIVAYLRSHEQMYAYRLAADASQEAVDLATLQYTNGLVDFNTVITVLQNNLQQQDLLASTSGTVATNLAQVYKALGGGWEIRNNQDPVDFLPAAMKQQMRSRTDAWKGVLH
jgi:NodT family efflux transporter outer membrane factor (OMF) lipoprotein